MGRTRASQTAAGGAIVAAADVVDDGAVAGWLDMERRYVLVDGVDPDIHELCEAYNIEPRKMYRLHSIMLAREDTFESDILKLWDSFKNARQPNAVISKKIQDMEAGSFIGKAPKRYYHERRLKEFFKRHDIDPLCKDSLADALYDRRMRIIRDRKMRGGSSGDGDGLPEKDMRDVLVKLDSEITDSRNPSALVMRHIPGIEAGTGKWSDVGQLQEAQRGPILSEAELQKMREREEEAQASKKAKVLAASKEVALQQMASMAQPALSVPMNPLNFVDGSAGFGKPAKKTKAPAFDSSELAMRLSRATPVEEEPQQSSEATPLPQDLLAPEPEPAPPPLGRPVEPPPPEPAKNRPFVPLRLSKQSLEQIVKSEEMPASASSSGSKNVRSSEPAPEPKHKDSSNSFHDMEELEIVAIATGRSVQELKHLSQEQLRALVEDGGEPKGRGEDASGSEQEGGEDFGEMSELEIVSIATGRSVEELEKLSKKQLRALIGGGASGSASPSPEKKPRRVASRSKSHEPAAKELATSRSREEAPRSRSCRRRGSPARAASPVRERTTGRRRSCDVSSSNGKVAVQRSRSRSPCQGSYADRSRHRTKATQRSASRRQSSRTSGMARRTTSRSYSPSRRGSR